MHDARAKLDQQASEHAAVKVERQTLEVRAADLAGRCKHLEDELGAVRAELRSASAGLRDARSEAAAAITERDSVQQRLDTLSDAKQRMQVRRCWCMWPMR